MNIRARLAITVLVAGVFYIINRPARGIRNNNPLNIERTSDNWQGMAAVQTDSRFVNFVDPRWGYRAAARILQNYGAAGIVTLEQIINRWAPPIENNSRAYVESVSAKIGVEPDGSPWDRLPELLAAMTVHENGSNPYSMELIREGVSWA